MHRVAALCLDWVVAFDLSSAVQVFASARQGDGRGLYEVTVCSPERKPVPTSTGFEIVTRTGLEALAAADTVVVPACGVFAEPPPEGALEALGEAGERGARIVSVCTGAFVLGHAGLLDGRRCTTHWAWADLLAETFPRAQVDAAALYVDGGAVSTSAGLSAGIDLCLHLVREDHGAAVGSRAARWMVAAPHREGGQAQFIDRGTPEASGSLESTRRWAAERLDQPLDVAAMSRHAAVSPRTFARRFRAETGTTPLQWLLGCRVLEARRLLEETDIAVDEIALRAGFGTGASLREHFRRFTATTPSAYRRAFKTAAAA